MRLGELSKNEKSLLLYLEARTVDYGGRVDIRRINEQEMEIIEEWKKKGFIEFGRIVARHHSSEGTHWCKLSDEAWFFAHNERKARAERLWVRRNWIGTEESKEINGNPHLSGLNSGDRRWEH